MLVNNSSKCLQIFLQITSLIKDVAPWCLKKVLFYQFFIDDRRKKVVTANFSVIV